MVNYAQIMYQIIGLIGDLEAMQYDDLAIKLHEAAYNISQEAQTRHSGETQRRLELQQLEAMWSNG